MARTARIEITHASGSATVTVEEHWIRWGPNRPWSCVPAAAIGPAGLTNQYWETPVGSRTSRFIIVFWANVPGRGSVPTPIFELDFSAYAAGIVGTGAGGNWPFSRGQTGDGSFRLRGGPQTGDISYEVL